ncbi:MAG: hydrogenase formation protein HypD [Megasphaera elsdenii]|jgi:hydrogenase expression/formation protein HypD|uniref:hydrogenase formation protein HypD n=1 Tax=Megasphaera elsdenii TaxID=907 RepID=UPI00195D4A78|nr:hydrogenase formation protein HypD [Megasphaera elsdenii]MBM6702386.1 hydrogenase formation protein HypD [Megasphaera elsdenii]MCI7431412.1 hydrogenase formation protein HypD [Megasphaera elsdenii]MDD7070546.1 hydrogenase formation protein HypD [Megasphaera elsdenii]MDY4264251.1 hydrogenase formation protein HypD [Megasphaera elsdenii]MDY4727636.1 hydrogenase formation protein HypD [Megasphaera elsdenii]
MAEAKKRTALDIIRSYDGPKIRIMEVCGTHTHEIFRQGIRQILPPQVDVISGPGCPVCVTPVGYIDQAIWLALEKGVTICTFGDLVRVPGSTMSLADARSEGAHVEIVYSPLDAYDYAKAHPDENVVFLSVGFETTTPPSCLAVKQAVADGMTNFSLLTANKTMPMAYEAMKDSADAFLYPGHVDAVMGTGDGEAMLKEGVSGVVAGFTAKELLTAFAVILAKFPQGKPFFKNCYPRVVKAEGSPAAQALMKEVMEPCDSEWRGLGVIPQSGQQLRPAFAVCDARKKYGVPDMDGRANPACRCGDILKGQCKPPQCPLFGKVCTPEHPVGACMVSHEGACSAYYLYGGNLHE